MTYSNSTYAVNFIDPTRYYHLQPDVIYTSQELEDITGFTRENGLGFLAQRGIYPIVSADFVEYNSNFNTLVSTFVITNDEAIETTTITPISLADAKAYGKSFLRQVYSARVEKAISESGYGNLALVAAASKLVGDRGADVQAVILSIQGLMTSLDTDITSVNGFTTNDEIQGFLDTVDTVDYTVFEVTVSGGNFYIDGVQQAALNLEVGKKYRFNQSDATNAGHPLKIYLDAAKTRLARNVASFGTPGTLGAYTQFTPYYSRAFSYQCEVHAAMGGDITVS